MGLLALALTVGCQTSAPPLHLTVAKQAIVAYYDGGAYQHDVEQAMEQATKLLAEAPPRADEAPWTVILDVDDTAISSWDLQKQMGLGFYYPLLEAWRREGTAPAIEPVLRFYQEARVRHFRIVFLTGRRETYRTATEENLRRAGYDVWEKLIMKADDDRRADSLYKRETRQQLIEAGAGIWLNIGDQAGDVDGGFARHGIRLPNYVYQND